MDLRREHVAHARQAGDGAGELAFAHVREVPPFWVVRSVYLRMQIHKSQQGFDGILHGDGIVTYIYVHTFRRTGGPM